MQKIYKTNFFDLFEFSKEKQILTRLSILCEGKFYDKGYSFNKDEKCGGWDLYKNIDNIPLLKYFPEKKYIELISFSPVPSRNDLFSNVKLEERIYRFSKIEYLKKSLQEGEFLLRPSIYYLKEEHNKARLDNEHKIIHELPDSEVKNLSNNSSFMAKNIIKTVVDTNLNQYILCFSHLYDELLYEEFEGSDGCLVITDTEEFNKRIQNCLNGYMCIGKRVFYSKVEDIHGLMFSKEIDYLKQNEFRYLWVDFDNPIECNPVSLSLDDYDNIKHLIPKNININIGSIEDIAFVLDKNGNRLDF